MNHHHFVSFRSLAPSALSIGLFAMLFVCPGCKNSTLQSRVHFDLNDSQNTKIVEVAFLRSKDSKDFWSGSDELIAVAPSIRDPVEIAQFVEASKLDLPAKPGKEYLAGTVCHIVVVGEGGRILESSELFSGDSVLVPTIVKYLPQKGFSFPGYRNIERSPSSRKAPAFGKFVLDYLKRHNPERYGKGVWLIDMERMK